MSVKIFSLRWKIIVLFAVSIILSLGSVAGLIQILHQIGSRDRSSAFYLMMKGLQNQIGVMPLGAVAGFAFFVLFFFILSRGSLLFVEKISRTLQQVSLGELDAHIEPRSQDELGELAENINRMTARLKASLEEERNAERSKDELITSVSHDLRTPLTSIVGYLELIGRGKDADPDELRRYAGIALQKSLQMKKLIDDLFEYAIVRDGQIKLRTSRIDLRELLAQLSEEFVPVFQAGDRTCRMTSDDPGHFVRADGDMIMRVFENLLSNAVRYGRPGGTIGLDISQDGPWTAVRVSSAGDPIPAGDLPRIFDRFFRSNRAGTERSGGAGLGLAIAKSIIDLHGGEISVRSERDLTVFEVRLKSEP